VLRRGEAILTRSAGAAAGSPRPAAPTPPAAPRSPALPAGRDPHRGDEAPEPSRALALAAHYATVPVAPPLYTGPGAVAVVGYRTEALAVAEHLAAGSGARVVLATNRPVTGDAAAAPLRSAEEAFDLARPKGKTGRRVRTAEQLLLVVDLGDGPSGLLFAQQVLQAIKAEQVRLVVNVDQDRDDADATIHLLGRVDAIDVVLPPEGAVAIDPAPLLDLSAPVATLDGLPATPGLWSALTMEREAHRG
jgi:hypothetical protein